MPDEIDLGDGVTAEFEDGEFALSDGIRLNNSITLSVEAARKFCRFVEEKAGRETP